MERPRYGTPNVGYVSTWFTSPEDRPMWALNLMKYRPVADYRDGRDLRISGADADLLYNPTGPLTDVGGGVLLAADVVHQLSGDSVAWDRVAVAFYPRRLAMIEMQSLPEFVDLHVHKDAAMDFTIVMATMPSPHSPAPHDWSVLAEGDLLLVQVVADPAATDLAGLVPSRRIGLFDIEGVIVGDDRTWVQVRYDIVSEAAADELVTAAAAHADPSHYAMVVRPRLELMGSV